jgi:hypothetical protein
MIAYAEVPEYFRVRFQFMMAIVVSGFSNHEAGIVSHLLAVTACGVAWAKSSWRNRVTATVGFFELFLLFDAVFHWRWELHQMLVETAVNLAVYDKRTLPQEVLSALLISAILIAAVAAIPYASKSPGACLALVGGLISAVLWALQVVSLHAIDTVFERRVGLMSIVAWAWFGSSALVILGVLWKRSPRRNTEQGGPC